MSPKPRRKPHVMVEYDVSENAKMADLPSDAARLGYFYAVLGRAKVQRPAGQFRSRQLWREVAGRFGNYLAAYLSTGLVEEAPALCPKCKKHWPGIADKALVVHDWHDHQSDPGAAGRAADWRKGQDTESEPDAEWDGLNADQTADQTVIERGLNSDRTLNERSISCARDARSRAARVSERRTLNVNENLEAHNASVRDQEPDGEAIAYLAQHGAYVAATSAGLRTKLTRLIDLHGWPAVRMSFETFAASGATEARQYIHGADNALNPVPNTASNSKTTRSLSDTDFDADMIGAGADWIARGDA